MFLFFVSLRIRLSFSLDMKEKRRGYTQRDWLAPPQRRQLKNFVVVGSSDHKKLRRRQQSRQAFIHEKDAAVIT